MRALTPEIWAEHHEDLADVVVEREPGLTRAQVELAGGDFGALAEVVADVTGSSVEEARRDLSQIRVDERELGSSDPGMTLEETPGRASTAQLRLGGGFTEGDQPLVLRYLSQLDRRLQRFPADATELEISVKERGTTDQSVTLEAWLPRLPHMVARSTQQDLPLALTEVRDAMLRQIDEALGKRRPYE